MLVVLRDPVPGGPPAILGKYGKQSWASQTPADPDLYLQEVWPTDQQGLVEEQELDSGSHGGLWINGDRIARIELLSGGCEKSAWSSRYVEDMAEQMIKEGGYQPTKIRHPGHRQP